MGQKDGDFLFWSTPEPVVTFLGLKKSRSSLRSFFWDNLDEIFLILDNVQYLA